MMDAAYRGCTRVSTHILCLLRPRRKIHERRATGRGIGASREEPASKKVILAVAEIIEQGKLSHRGGKRAVAHAVERPDYSQWGLGQKIGRAACAVARGYRVTTSYVTISSPTARTLDTVLTEWRECRADKMEMSAESYLVPFKGYADAYKGQKAVECLSGRGYVVVDIPPMVDRADPMRPTR